MNEKALSWLVLVLNEDNLLYYCFQEIFQNQAFMSFYNKEHSYLHNDRKNLTEIS
jgi:hypothetical protein